jgi:hypothetical protein
METIIETQGLSKSYRWKEAVHQLDIRLTERGESFYNPYLEGVVADLDAAGLLVTDEGARCVFLEGVSGKEGKPLPVIVQKSDGGFNYATTDLAAIRYRFAAPPAGDGARRLIYVTDAGQASHFAGVFQVARRAGWIPPHARLEHVPFGLVQGEDGRKLKILFQTSTNPVRQKVQQVVKQSCQKAGIEFELKSVPASVFFSSDAGNSDTFGRFQADIQMYAWTRGGPDPRRPRQNFVSWEAASKANKWLGLNRGRWINADYDAAYRAADVELDPVKRAALFIRMNDLVVGDVHVIPIVFRPDVAAVARNLVAPLSSWDTAISPLADWYREG